MPGSGPRVAPSAYAANRQANIARAAELRAAILAGLRANLGGDELAAEFVLLACVSRILARHGDTPVGKLHLNILGCPPACRRRLRLHDARGHGARRR